MLTKRQLSLKHSLGILAHKEFSLFHQLFSVLLGLPNVIVAAIVSWI